jgi:hypothetical protein
MKVEGLCTDTNRVDCVRLKQVGGLGLQPRKPVRNATVAMSSHEQSLSKAAKSESHILVGPHDKAKQQTDFLSCLDGTLKQKSKPEFLFHVVP